MALMATAAVEVTAVAARRVITAPNEAMVAYATALAVGDGGGSDVDKKLRYATEVWCSQK